MNERTETKGGDATLSAVEDKPIRVTLSEPGFSGSYEVVERRLDGTLVLRPRPERLSEIERETAGRVFRDEEFAAHLERVARSEDDLPADRPG